MPLSPAWNRCCRATHRLHQHRPLANALPQPFTHAVADAAYPFPHPLPQPLSFPFTITHADNRRARRGGRRNAVWHRAAVQQQLCCSRIVHIGGRNSIGEPCSGATGNYSICNPNEIYAGQYITIPLNPVGAGAFTPDNNPWPLIAAAATPALGFAATPIPQFAATVTTDVLEWMRKSVLGKPALQITTTPTPTPIVIPVPDIQMGGAQGEPAFADTDAAIYQGTPAFVNDAFSADVSADFASFAGYMTSTWAGAAETGVDYDVLSAAAATVRLADGTLVGSGQVNAWSLGGQRDHIAFSGAGLDFSVDGWGNAGNYAPALSGLGTAINWSGYILNITATAFDPANFAPAILSIDGVFYGYGNYLIEFNSPVQVWGGGANLLPAFSNEWQTNLDQASVHLAPGVGSATLGAHALDVTAGLGVAGFSGTLTVTEQTTTTDRLQLTGTVAQVIQLDQTPATNTIIPFQSAQFQVDVLSNISDTYYLEVAGPIGWQVNVDSSGLVTVQPGPEVAQVGSYTFVVTAQSYSRPELVATLNHTVNITPHQGMLFDLTPDGRFTVPIGPAAPDAAPGDTNTGQLQLPDATFAAVITNTSTVSHTFNVALTGILPDWLIVGGAAGQTDATITLPAGGVGTVGIYISPTLPLPGPGTAYPFDVTATAVDNPALTETRGELFVVPAIPFNYLTADPALIYASPNITATFNLAVENVGNATGDFPITVTLPVTTWSGSYTHATGPLPAAATFDQVVTFVPTGAAVGENHTIRIDSPAPATAYTQSTSVQVAIRGPETVCAYEAVQLAPATDPGLVAALDNLLTQLELWTDLGNLGQRNNTVAAIQEVAVQLGSYAGLTVTGQLTTIAGQMSGHTDPGDLAGDRTALGNILCQDLHPVLSLLAAYNPAMSVFPTVLATLPGRTVTPTLTVINYGDAPATATFSLQDVPAGWSVITPTQVSLLPGVAQQVGLPVTPGVLGTDTFDVILALQEAPGLVVSRTVTVRVVSELLRITDVTLDPNFLNVGTGTTDVSIRLANPAGLRAATTAGVQLTDAGGAVRKTLSAPFNVAVNNEGPFFLGQLDITGLEQGVYTATVRLLDTDGTVIPNAVGANYLAIGQDLQVAYDHQPVLVAPGLPGIDVTTMITTTRTDVLTGTVPFTPTLKWARSVSQCRGRIIR